MKVRIAFGLQWEIYIKAEYNTGTIKKRKKLYSQCLRSLGKFYFEILTFRLRLSHYQRLHGEWLSLPFIGDRPENMRLI